MLSVRFCYSWNFFRNIDFQRRNYGKTLIGKWNCENSLRFCAITHKLKQIESKFKKYTQENPCGYIYCEPRPSRLHTLCLTDVLKKYSIISENSLYFPSHGVEQIGGYPDPPTTWYSTLIQNFMVHNVYKHKAFLGGVF